MKPPASRRPDRGEYEHEYHHQLITKVSGECVIEVLQNQLYWICELASHLSTDQVDRVHPPYQWTVRQVVEHVANSERLFGCRVMLLADGSEPNLPGWDENVSADSRFGLGNFSRLVTELGELRKSSIGILTRLKPSVWDCPGIVEGNRVNVRTLAWIMAGHLQHHFEIVEKRCGITAIRQPPKQN